MKKFCVFFLISITIPYFIRAEEFFKYGISIFDDLKYPKNFQSFDYVNINAPKGGDVKFGVEGSFNSLNPFILKGIPASGIDMIYDSLMESASDEISSMYPLIAEGIIVSNEKNYVEFVINSAAKWHDNKKIDADDVIFTFKTLIKEGHPSYKIALKDVVDVVKVKKNKVKFILKNGFKKDIPFLLASIKILPKHFYEKRLFNSTEINFLLGSGPYKILSIDPKKSITYKRNENYWGKNLPVNKGRYNFDKITYEYYLDQNVLIESFKSGKLDFRYENIARNWANLYNVQNIINGKIIKKQINHSMPAPTQAFILNLRKTKFQDKNFRMALNYAFNFEWIQKHIFYGSYKRTESYFDNSEFSFNDKNPKPFKLPISDRNGFGRNNLLVAKKILDESGYKVINGKLISPFNNEVVRIEFLIDSRSFEMIIAPFIDNLKKLGIDAKMKLLEENQYQSRVRNFNYDVIVGNYPANLVPSSELIRYWHSSQKNIHGSQNYSGIDNKEVDDLVLKIASAKSKDELIKLCKEFDFLMLSNYYTILHWHSDVHRVLYNSKIQMPKKLPKYSLAIDSWWIGK